MSKEQQLIDSAIDLANKGILSKDNIKKVIKEDFLRSYHSASSLENLYNTLSKKYGYCRRSIQEFCK